MTLWLSSVALAVAIWVAHPQPARDRLANCVGASPGRDAASPTVSGDVLLVGAVLGSGLAALSVPPVLAAAAALAPAAVRVIRRHRADARVRVARETAVVETAFALAAELRAGRSAREALLAAADTAGPLCDVLRAAGTAVDIGGSAAAELEAGAALPGGDRLRAIAAAWRVTESAGGRIAVVLERLGEAMDRDDEIRREMQAALAAPRATMMLLAGLPAIGLGLGQAIGARPLHLLLYRPVGWALIGGAVVLDAIGIAVSRRITTWALR